MRYLLYIFFCLPTIALTQHLIVTTSSQKVGSNFVCENSLGGSKDYGRFTFCWDNITVPAGDGTAAGNRFANQSLQLAIEESPSMVINDPIDKQRLMFSVIPRNPVTFPSAPYNYRAEIIQNPWLANLPDGSEEWYAYEVTFPTDYVPDKSQSWSMMQHKSTDWYSDLYDPNDPIWIREKRTTPVLSLHLSKQGYIGSSGGEITILNFADKPLPSYADQTDQADRFLTGVFPKAGQSYRIVQHIIHSVHDNVGLWEVWIDGNLVYSQQRKTLYPEVPQSGNFKVGVYMPYWRTETGVSNSESFGVYKMELYMGPLKVIRKRPSDPDYLSDEFNYMCEIFK